MDPFSVREGKVVSVGLEIYMLTVAGRKKFMVFKKNKGLAIIANPSPRGRI